MTRRVVLGGSFNPPHVWHLAIVKWLAGLFDEVVVVPCGVRRDKSTVSDIDSVHRAAMCDLTFRGIKNVRVDHFDMEREAFSTAVELQGRYGGEGVELWHAVGTDLVVPREDGKVDIRDRWHRGGQIWNQFNWFVIRRPGYEIPAGAELPAKCEVATGVVAEEGSSRDIRRRNFLHNGIDGLVTPEVAAYVERHNLYRGTPSYIAAHLQIKDPKPFIVHDPYNPRAAAMAARLSDIAVPLERANMILVLGGDGTMLRAIKKHWRLRLPFVGFNFGHVGHLMNMCDGDMEANADRFRKRAFERELLIGRLLPLLHVRYADAEGKWSEAYAFNDVWVERSEPRPIVMEASVSVGGRMWRFEQAIGDGLLMATAAGSTAYAQSMGAVALSVEDSHGWLLIGNNIGKPYRGIPQTPLGVDAIARVKLCEVDWRHARLCADTEMICSHVSEYSVRLSAVASAELVFVPENDLVTKKLDQQIGHTE